MSMELMMKVWETVQISGTRLWLRIFRPARDPTSLAPASSGLTAPLLCCSRPTNDGYAEQTRDSGHPVV